MVRHWFSIIVFFLGFYFTVYTSGGVLDLKYLDIVSFIIAGVVPFLFVSILYGFKNMALSFSILKKKNVERENLITAYDFFCSFGKIIWITGLIATIISVSETLVYYSRMEDSPHFSSLAPNLVVAALAILYSGIFNMVIIIPKIILIKKRMKDHFCMNEGV